MRNPKTGNYYTDIYGHYDVSDYEAEDFINWLIYDKKLSSYSLLEELEYQIAKKDADYKLKELCINTIAKIPLYCDLCHRLTLYGDGKKVYRYKTEEHTHRISSSLVGGSNVYKKTTMTYASEWDFYCVRCLTEAQKLYKEEKKRKTIKGLIQKIFGKGDNVRINEKPKKVSLFNVITNILLSFVVALIPSFIIGAVVGVGNLSFSLIIGGTLFIIIIIANFKSILEDIANYKEWKEWKEWKAEKK